MSTTAKTVATTQPINNAPKSALKVETKSTIDQVKPKEIAEIQPISIEAEYFTAFERLKSIGVKMRLCQTLEQQLAKFKAMQLETASEDKSIRISLSDSSHREGLECFDSTTVQEVAKVVKALFEKRIQALKEEVISDKKAINI